MRRHDNPSWIHTHILRDEEKVAARGKTTRYILCADRDWRLVTCLSKQSDIDKQMTTTNHSSPIEVLLCVELASDRSNWKTFSQLAAMDEKSEKGCVAINSIMHAALSLSLLVVVVVVVVREEKWHWLSIYEKSIWRSWWLGWKWTSRARALPWSALAVAV